MPKAPKTDIEKNLENENAKQFLRRMLKKYGAGEEIARGGIGAVYDMQDGRLFKISFFYGTPAWTKKNLEMLLYVYDLGKHSIFPQIYEYSLEKIDQYLTGIAYVMQRIEFYPFEDWLKIIGDPYLLAYKLFRAFRKLHKLGLTHPDVSESNVILKKNGKFAFLDLESGCVKDGTMCKDSSFNFFSGLYRPPEHISTGFKKVYEKFLKEYIDNPTQAYKEYASRQVGERNFEYHAKGNVYSAAVLLINSIPNMDDELKDIIAMCLEPPDERPSAPEVMREIKKVMRERRKLGTS